MNLRQTNRPRRFWIAVAGTALAMLAIVLLAFPTFAWDCRRYNFRVTSGGDAQVENRSGSDEPAQQADVYIPADHYSGTVDVPAMPAGTGWTTFLNVVPPAGDWTWRIVGSKDCEDSGEHEGKDPTNTPPPKDTPTDIPTDTPEPSATPVTPTLTASATDTPTDIPTDTATLTETKRPPPTETRPPPTEPPEPTRTKPPPTKEKTPEPTQTATPKVPTPTPSTATITPTATPGCPCCCGYSEHVSAWVDLEPEAWLKLEAVLRSQQQMPDVNVDVGMLFPADVATEIAQVNDNLAGTNEQLADIRQALFMLGVAILGVGASGGFLYYGMNRNGR